MIGSCLAYLRLHRPELLARHQNAQSFAGLLLIALALIFINPDKAFPGFWALLPAMGSFLLLSAGERGWVNRHLLATAPMVWCGLISYPLYLWHWPFLSFTHIIFESPYSAIKAIPCIAAAVVAATFTFWFIERPFRRSQEGPGKTFFLLGTMASTLGCGAVIMTQVIPPRLYHFDAPAQSEFEFLKQKTARFNKQGTGIYALNAERPNLVLFIGDSHIAQYARRLDKVMGAEPNRPGAILALGGGCIPIEGVKTDDIRRDNCWALRNDAFKMAEESRFKTIVIGGAWCSYFLIPGYAYDDGVKRIALTSPEGKQLALERLGQRIKMLMQSGKHVIFVLDNPLSSAFSPKGWAIRLSLSAKNFKPNSTVEVSAKQFELNQELLNWAKGCRAIVIDPFGAICTGNVCNVTTATGQPLFKDASHFNPEWAIDHAAFIDAAVIK